MRRFFELLVIVISTVIITSLMVRVWTENADISPVSGFNIFSKDNISIHNSRKFETFRVDCKSNSMKFLDCNDTVLCRDFEGKYDLIPGKIYVYRKNGTNVVHRFIGIVDGKLIFKGDNNKVIDKPVLLNQLRCKLVGWIDKDSKNEIDFRIK